MKKKSIKVWIILLVAPYVLLILTALAQIGLRSATAGGPCSIETSSGSSLAVQESGEPVELGRDCKPSGTTLVRIVVNIISLVVGVVAVVGILATPVWIIFLILAIKHNNELQAPGPPPFPPAPS